MARRTFFIFLFSFVAVISVFSITLAAEPTVKEIIAEGKYQMGDNDTPAIASERALLNAKRDALEQAGTYIASSTQVKNFITVDDNVTALAAGTMEVTVLDRKRTQVGDGMEFWVKIKAKVYTDKLAEAVLTGKIPSLQRKKQVDGKDNIAILVSFRSKISNPSSVLCYTVLFEHDQDSLALIDKTILSKLANSKINIIPRNVTNAYLSELREEGQGLVSVKQDQLELLAKQRGYDSIIILDFAYMSYTDEFDPKVLIPFIGLIGPNYTGKMEFMLTVKMFDVNTKQMRLFEGIRGIGQTHNAGDRNEILQGQRDALKIMMTEFEKQISSTPFNQ